MSIEQKINNTLQTEVNTGFGVNASNNGGRLINKNGSTNLEKRGVSWLDQISWFHTLLSLSRFKFISVVFLFFIIANLFFATLYYIIGVENLNGISGLTEIEKFGQAYFFSAQTFTTVGYGHISPNGFLTSAVAATEALVGLLAFALATGLLYGRFSKPTAHIKFSDNAIIAPYHDGRALMLRMAPYKNTNLFDAEAKITLALVFEENGNRKNKFFPLKLEFEKITALTHSWTLVHPINAESPLYQFTQSDFDNQKGEIIVYVKAFDEMFSSMVSTRTSYDFNEFVYGAKFDQMYHTSQDGSKTILELDKLNSLNRIILD